MSSDSVIVLDDRYRLLDELGHGGMSDVFRATDELLQREVAVKVLREVEDPVLRARFIAEAQLLARLNHPGLVTLLDAGIRADRPYLVMTLAEGPTLGAQLAEGALPPQTVAEIGTQVAAALAYAHEQGVTHRDVKPSNVLLCADSRALLADFGIARLAGDLEQHTRTGETIGSPAYLSPEQAAGEAVTSAADIYSLGLVLLEALTGERAFPGAPLETAVQRLVASPAMPVSLPRPWRDLLTAMTARDPAARPTAGEVASATAAIATGTAPALPEPDESTQPLAVTPDGREPSAAGPEPVAPDPAAPEPVAPESRAPEPLAPEPLAPRRGRRRWWLLAAALLVAALVVGVLLVQLSGDTEPADRGTEVPANVPERYQQPLQDLHDAIEEPR